MDKCWICHRHNTSMLKYKLLLPYRRRSYGQNTIWFLLPKLWDNLPAGVKSSTNVITFKHDIRKTFFSQLCKKENEILLIAWERYIASCNLLLYCLDCTVFPFACGALKFQWDSRDNFGRYFHAFLFKRLANSKLHACNFLSKAFLSVKHVPWI